MSEILYPKYCQCYVIDLSYESWDGLTYPKYYQCYAIDLSYEPWDGLTGDTKMTWFTIFRITLKSHKSLKS